jgi:hypothetical protein
LTARHAWTLLAVGLATALLWLAVGTQETLPGLERGREDWSGDFRSYYLPNAEYAAARIAAGDLPLWNAHQGAGGPFLATLQTGVLYPPNLLHALLPVQAAFLVLAFLHLALAVVLAGVLASALGATAAGSAVAGLAYGTSLSLVGFIWVPPLLYAAAWAPGALLAVDRSIARASARGATAVALSFALMLLAGWPFIFAMVALAAALYAAPLLIARAVRTRRFPAGPVAALGAGAGAGLLLAAPLLLPASELLARSCRALGSIIEAQAIFVPRPHDPAVFLATLTRRGFNDAVPGAAALVLSSLALVLPGPGRARLAVLLGTGAVALLASFPDHAPVYGWLRELPALGDFRFPFRYRLVTTLALSIGAGVGTAHLQQTLRRWPRLAAGAGAAALAVCVLTSALPVFRLVSPFARSVPPARTLVEELREAGVAAPIAGRGRVYWDRHSSKLRRPRDTYALHDMEPLTLARTAQILTFFETGRPRTLLTLPPARVWVGQPRDTIASPFYGYLTLPDNGRRAGILDLLSTTTIVTKTAPAWLDRRYQRVSPPDAKLAVFENPHALPRAYRVSRAVREPPDLAVALRRITSSAFDPRRLVMLDDPPPRLVLRAGVPAPPASGEVRITVYEPERVVLQTSGDEAGIAILTDAHFPGWEATLDGAPVALLRANTSFRGVVVTAGEHEIEMRYRPATFRWGVVLALAAAIACACAVWVEARGRSRHPRAPDPRGGNSSIAGGIGSAAELRAVRELKDDGFAHTRVVEMDGKLWVHKRFRFRFFWGRPFAPLARAFMRHELNNCRRLEGVRGAAWRAMPCDNDAFLREWFEGSDLKARKRERRRVPDAFFDEFREALDQVHARGLAYNDLAKSDNVIITDSGHPVLIDFQISLRSYRGGSRLLRALSDWWIPRLQREDIRHFCKMKRRFRPDLITVEERAASRRRSGLAHAQRVGWKLIHPIKRVFYPKGSNEKLRFSRRS